MRKVLLVVLGLSLIFLPALVRGATRYNRGTIPGGGTVTYGQNQNDGTYSVSSGPVTDLATETALMTLTDVTKNYTNVKKLKIQLRGAFNTRVAMSDSDITPSTADGGDYWLLKSGEKFELDSIDVDKIIIKARADTSADSNQTLVIQVWK